MSDLWWRHLGSWRSDEQGLPAWVLDMVAGSSDDEIDEEFARQHLGLSLLVTRHATMETLVLFHETGLKLSLEVLDEEDWPQYHDEAPADDDTRVHWMKLGINDEDVAPAIFPTKLDGASSHVATTKPKPPCRKCCSRSPCDPTAPPL